MGKKKINAKNNIREFPYEGVRRDNRIKELANRLKLKPHHLKNLLDQKLKPGVKVFGKRLFSNVDTMAGYLNEVGKKNLANTPRSEIKPIYDPAMGVTGITDAQKLKYLSQVHEIHPSVIKDALKAGANPKSLIKTMMSETISSDTISKFLREKTGEKWKESNERKRSAKEVKNKIVSSDQLSSKPSQKMFKAIAEGIPKSEQLNARRRVLKKTARSRMKAGRMRYWKPDYLNEKNTGDPRLQKMSKSARNTEKLKMKKMLKMALDHPDFKKLVHKKGWNPISLEQQSKQFRSLDNSIKFQQGEYQGKHFSETQKMAKSYYDNLYKFHKTNETRALQLQKKERGRLLYEINKKLKAGITAPNIPKSSRLKTGMSGGVKGDVMSTAASIIADVLGERVIDPLTKKLVEKTIGPQLIKLREENDKRRKRKQSL